MIHAIVDVMQPTVDDYVVDPACGAGGFLVAHEQARGTRRWDYPINGGRRLVNADQQVTDPARRTG